MGGSKRQLDEINAKIAEEYVQESLCPTCGDEREEITLDHNTFWVCDNCDCDREEPEFHEPDWICNDEPPSAQEAKEPAVPDRFQLETDITNLHTTADDIDMLAEAVLEKDLSKDDLANALSGISTLLRLRIDKTFDTFKAAFKLDGCGVT